MYKSRGMINVTICYIFWGVLPAFWKLLSTVNPFYILANRILWSLIFITLFLGVTIKHKNRFKVAFQNKKAFWLSALSGLFVTINWGSYIWAVNNNHILDASYGYYLNPLMVVIIGTCIFKEKLARSEWIAVILAALGVIYAMIASGVFPILAFVIGGSFAIYGTIKKYISYDSETSLFAETLWCAPFALLFIGMMEVQNKGVLYQFDWKIAGLLCISGIVTLIPLVFYAHGVKQCPYYITGILMYINPTLQMIMGLVFGETIKGYQIVSFCCIWIGIIILIYHNLKQKHQAALLN